MTYEYCRKEDTSKCAHNLTGISLDSAIPRLHNSIFISWLCILSQISPWAYTKPSVFVPLSKWAIWCHCNNLWSDLNWGGRFQEFMASSLWSWTNSAG